jgi:hypothetical protein
MQKHDSITRLYAALSASLLAVSLSTFAFAQAKPAAKSRAKSSAAPATQTPAQRQLLSLQFLRIKPGMGPEWQEFRKSETLPALRKAQVKEQGVWNTAVFGEGGYVIVTPIENLAQYDGGSPIVRALGQEGGRAYGAKAARFTESAHSVAIETRPDLSIPPSPSAEPKLAVVTTTTIVAGRDDEYENFIKTAVLPAVKKAAPKGYLVSRVVYGGNLNQYHSVVLLDNFADLQRWREAFAKEATTAKLAAKSVGIVTSRENAIYRFVPDLSIMPARQKVENK